MSESEGQATPVDLPDYLHPTPENIERAYERTHTTPITREWTHFDEGSSAGEGPSCLCPMAVLTWCAIEDGYYPDELTPTGLDDGEFDAIATSLYGEWFTVGFVRAFDQISPNAQASMEAMHLLRRPTWLTQPFVLGDAAGRAARLYLQGRGWRIRYLPETTVDTDDV